MFIFLGQKEALKGYNIVTGEVTLELDAIIGQRHRTYTDCGNLTLQWEFDVTVGMHHSQYVNSVNLEHQQR